MKKRRITFSAFSFIKSLCMKEYRTSDLYFSAYLITAGCILQKTDKQGNRVFFVFEHIVLIDELKLQYFNGEAKVKAQHYASQIKNLKSLTHQVMNSNGSG